MNGLTTGQQGGHRLIDCYTCKGKGSYPVAGFLAVLDWPCSACKGTGRVDHPQDCPQPQQQIGGQR